jgi:hypothetical protein
VIEVNDGLVFKRFKSMNLKAFYAHSLSPMFREAGGNAITR